MDFALSEEQVMIFDMAKAFGEEHIAPFAMEWEAAGTRAMVAMPGYMKRAK